MPKKLTSLSDLAAEAHQARRRYEKFKRVEAHKMISAIERYLEFNDEVGLRKYVESLTSPRFLELLLIYIPDILFALKSGSPLCKVGPSLAEIVGLAEVDPPVRRRGRPPIGDRAMTNAERMRKFRDKKTGPTD